jgi:hypothetical protein
MFINKTIFLIIYSLLGCNTSLALPKHVVIDPVFQPFVQDFIQDAASVGHPIIIDNLVIHFTTKLELIYLGECQDWSHGRYGTPIIKISQQNWSSLQLQARKSLLYHELGHCVLWLDHDDSWITTSLGDSIPRSLMYTSGDYSIAELKYWSYYINELFNGFEGLMVIP